MPFLDKLITEDMGDGNARLVHRFRYRIPDTKEIIEAEEGFITDFASIPRLLRMVITGQDNTKQPAVIHDKGYRSDRIHANRLEKYKARKRVDKIFYMGMRESGVPWWKRRMAYRGVRVGGMFSWVGKTIDKVG